MSGDAGSGADLEIWKGRQAEVRRELSDFEEHRKILLLAGDEAGLRKLRARQAELHDRSEIAEVKVAQLTRQLADECAAEQRATARRQFHVAHAAAERAAAEFWSEVARIRSEMFPIFERIVEAERSFTAASDALATAIEHAQANDVEVVPDVPEAPCAFWHPTQRASSFQNAFVLPSIEPGRALAWPDRRKIVKIEAATEENIYPRA